MQLPIGYDDFKEVLDQKLSYIDKTLFIKEVFDDKQTKAIVITRPRRFGKTLNLSLLHYFLTPHVYGQPTQGLFDGLAITQCGGDYLQHQGKYPVVLITFKDVKELNYGDAQENFTQLFSDLYLNYEDDLLSSPRLKDQHKQNFQRIVQKKGNQTELKLALKNLMQYLYLNYKVKPWLLIDEYDTPIQAAYDKGYYDEMIQFMRGLLGAALKNNPYLNKAVITGILRIAKESLFSGVNNLAVYSLLSHEYSTHFGFTESEVDHILTESHLSAQAAEIKAWYNGYQFGNTTIYNPWSIVNCVKKQGQTQPYWVNSSDNELIKDLLKASPLAFKAELEGLMRGESVERLIDENMVFGDLKNNPSALWSLFLMSGYLTPTSYKSTWEGALCQLRVPNREVNNFYRVIITLWLANGQGLEWYRHFIAALVSGDIPHFGGGLEKILSHMVSYHDLAKEPEAFFHALLLGLIASLHDTHAIQSNRESGLGRYDIAVFPNDTTQLGILIELKAKKSGETAALAALADAALAQIDAHHYLVEFKQRQIQRVIKMGIAFAGKQFVLRHAEESLR